MPCDHCPLAGAACPGGRYCQLTDPDHADHDPRYVAILLAKAGLASTLPSRPTPVNPEWVASESRAEAGDALTAKGEHARSLLADYARLDAMVNQCDHRGCKVGCGTSQCSLGAGDIGLDKTIASLTHCRLCVEGMTDASPYKNSEEGRRNANQS